jgi:polysaccharide pyruvyl transferase WcaK-like protein
VVQSVGGRNARFSPDVAFTLEPSRPARLSFEPAGVEIDNASPLVGLNISGLLYTGGYSGGNMFGLRSDYRETVGRVLTRLLTDTSATILLIPHTFGAEQEDEASFAVLESIRSACPTRTGRLTSTLTAREVKWLIGRTHFFIGSRMHACIAAMSQHVPTVGLGYSDKFLGVFESAGIGDAVVDLRQHDAEAASHEVLRLFACREATAARLNARIRDVQSQVQQAFVAMAGLA